MSAVNKTLGTGLCVSVYIMRGHHPWLARTEGRTDSIMENLLSTQLLNEVR